MTESFKNKPTKRESKAREAGASAEAAKEALHRSYTPASTSQPPDRLVIFDFRLKDGEISEANKMISHMRYTQRNKPDSLDILHMQPRKVFIYPSQ